MERGENKVLSKRHLRSFLDGKDDIHEIQNKVHSTEGAKEFGYKGALIGGVTLIGWMFTDALKVKTHHNFVFLLLTTENYFIFSKIFGKDLLEDGWGEFDLIRPVFPNLDFLCVMYGTSDPKTIHGELICVEDSKICVNCRFGRGKADWVPSLSIPSMKWLDESPKQLKETDEFDMSHYPILDRLTLENAPIGRDMLPREVFVSTIHAMEYVRTFIQDPSSIWTQLQPEGTLDPQVGWVPIHPAWIAAQMTLLIEKSLPHLPAIHTHTKLQMNGIAQSNQTLIFAGRFVDAFEKKNHHYAVVDAVVISKKSKQILAQLRHLTIFKIRSSL